MFAMPYYLEFGEPDRPILIISTWDCVFVDLCQTDTLRLNPLVSALCDLLEELISTGTHNFNWMGNIAIRLELILLLQEALYPKTFHFGTFQAVLHWAVVLSSPDWHERDQTSETSYEEEEGSKLESRMRNFISSQVLKHSPAALWAYIISQKPVGLPPSLLAELESKLPRMMLSTRQDFGPFLGVWFADLFLDLQCLQYQDPSEVNPIIRRNIQQEIRILAHLTGSISTVYPPPGPVNTELPGLLAKWNDELKARISELQARSAPAVSEADSQAGPHPVNETSTPTDDNSESVTSLCDSLTALVQTIETALEELSSRTGTVEQIN